MALHPQPLRGGSRVELEPEADASMHLLAGEKRAAAVLQAAVQEAIEARSGGGGGAQARWVAAAPWELEGELDATWKEREVRRGGGR